jgi:hypothetical protein
MRSETFGKREESPEDRQSARAARGAAIGGGAGEPGERKGRQSAHEWQGQEGGSGIEFTSM